MTQVLGERFTCSTASAFSGNGLGGKYVSLVSGSTCTSIGMSATYTVTSCGRVSKTLGYLLWSAHWHKEGVSWKAIACMLFYGRHRSLKSHGGRSYSRHTRVDRADGVCRRITVHRLCRWRCCVGVHLRRLVITNVVGSTGQRGRHWQWTALAGR